MTSIQLKNITRRGNKIFVIPRGVNEIKEHYIERCSYIANNYDSNEYQKISFCDLVNISRLWVNINFFNMLYCDEIMKMVKPHDI